MCLPEQRSEPRGTRSGRWSGSSLLPGRGLCFVSRRGGAPAGGKVPEVQRFAREPRSRKTLWLPSSTRHEGPAQAVCAGQAGGRGKGNYPEEVGGDIMRQGTSMGEVSLQTAQASERGATRRRRASGRWPPPTHTLSQTLPAHRLSHGCSEQPGPLALQLWCQRGGSRHPGRQENSSA